MLLSATGAGCPTAGAPGTIGGVSDTDGHLRDGPLVEAATLRALLDDPGRRAVVLDVRWHLGGPSGEDEYDAGHLPGAVFLDLDHDLDLIVLLLPPPIAQSNAQSRSIYDNACTFRPALFFSTGKMAL